MKKIVFLLALALVAAPAFAQQKTIEKAKIPPMKTKVLQRNIETALAGESITRTDRDVVLQTVTNFYNSVAKRHSNNTGSIMADLYKFAGWYEQRRASDVDSMATIAYGLEKIPLKTKDGKNFTAYSFVQMHLNEIAAEGALKEQMASTLGWQDNAAAQAYSAMNVMSEWKDHLVEDAAKATKAEQKADNTYTETEEFKTVKYSLDNFREQRKEDKREDASAVMQSILQNVADPLFTYYAQETRNYDTFTAKDPVAFEAIKAEINKPVQVGWQEEPILIKEYIRDHMNIANNWGTGGSQEAAEMDTLLRILQ